tara:strand:+ start:7960 stop:8109 length:150 start_codon:yes stop_codon:yes gene_type:complete
MTIKSLSKSSAPVVFGLTVFALSIRYFGDKPLIKEVKEGLKGNVIGIFK